MALAYARATDTVFQTSRAETESALPGLHWLSEEDRKAAAWSSRLSIQQIIWKASKLRDLHRAEPNSIWPPSPADLCLSDRSVDASASDCTRKQGPGSKDDRGALSSKSGQSGRLEDQERFPARVGA